MRVMGLEMRVMGLKMRERAGWGGGRARRALHRMPVAMPHTGGGDSL